MLNPSILLINKPVGLRSTECVQNVKKILARGTKIGHGGTLDSTAEGLLVLLTGGATRLSRLIMSLPKTYEVRIRLGSATSTDDASGDVIAESPWDFISTEMIDALLPGYMGWRAQIPPNISAVHVDGKRAHEIARSGGEIALQPKLIFIKSIRRLSDLSSEGEVSFQIECSKGTYIRSFARDLGEALACHAHVVFLKRCKLGTFEIGQALSAPDVFSFSPAELQAGALPLDCLIGTLPTYEARAEEEQKLMDGVPVKLGDMFFCSYGSFCLNEEILVWGNRLLSLCALKIIQGSYWVRPQTNIIRESIA